MQTKARPKPKSEEVRRPATPRRPRPVAKLKPLGPADLKKTWERMLTLHEDRLVAIYRDQELERRVLGLGHLRISQERLILLMSPFPRIKCPHSMTALCEPCDSRTTISDLNALPVKPRIRIAMAIRAVQGSDQCGPRYDQGPVYFITSSHERDVLLTLRGRGRGDG